MRLNSSIKAVITKLSPSFNNLNQKKAIEKNRNLVTSIPPFATMFITLSKMNSFILTTFNLSSAK